MDTIHKKRGEGYIPNSIYRDQAKDSGMAAVLICLLAAHFFDTPHLMTVGIVLLIINMIQPRLFVPFAKVLLGLSNLMGTFMSRMLLTFVFYSVLTPVATIRRLMGSDSMQLKKWREGPSSVFKIRDHRFEPKDIDKPY